MSDKFFHPFLNNHRRRWARLITLLCACVALTSFAPPICAAFAVGSRAKTPTPGATHTSIHAHSSNQAISIEGARLSQPSGSQARLVLELSKTTKHHVFALKDPYRLVIDLDNTQLNTNLDDISLVNSLVDKIRVSHRSKHLRIVLDLKQFATFNSFTLKPSGQYGDRLVVDLLTLKPIPASQHKPFVTIPATAHKESTNTNQGTTQKHNPNIAKATKPKLVSIKDRLLAITKHKPKKQTITKHKLKKH